MNIKQAQAKCTKLREKGDKKSLKQAQEIENKFKDHPDYEDDYTWLTRKQAGHG